MNSEATAWLVVLITAAVSVLCCLLALGLILKVGRFNGYIVLLVSLLASQISFDNSFFFLYFGGYSNNEHMEKFGRFLWLFGGISCSLWTNVIIGIVLYMVRTLHSVRVFKVYHHFFMLCVGLPMVLALCVEFSPKGQQVRQSLEVLYTCLRLLSFSFNVLAFVLSSWRLRVLSSSSNGDTRAPLRELSARLKYYPLAQMMSMVWLTVLDFSWRSNDMASIIGQVTDSASQGNVSTQALLYIITAMLPSGGMMYLVILLAVQPQFARLFRVQTGQGRDQGVCCCVYYAGLACGAVTGRDSWKYRSTDGSSDLSGTEGGAGEQTQGFSAGTTPLLSDRYTLVTLSLEDGEGAAGPRDHSNMAAHAAAARAAAAATSGGAYTLSATNSHDNSHSGRSSRPQGSRRLRTGDSVVAGLGPDLDVMEEYRSMDEDQLVTEIDFHRRVFNAETYSSLSGSTAGQVRIHSLVSSSATSSSTTSPSVPLLQTVQNT